ncbi:MAG: hypothetical protein JOZ28_07365 [Candidatus Eremiobacteraeota bacterium]|nr:hypothetical protein [Candidatus Eremiobacteraeota bacterium]
MSMFTRFSPAARAVTTLAEQECRNASHYYLGTEHLLLAMAIDPPADIADEFARMGLEPWLVKRALREAMGPGGDHPWDGILITPRVQRIVEAARAGTPDPELVKPIDLLRALVAEGGGVAARVLDQLAARHAARQP